MFALFILAPYMDYHIIRRSQIWYYFMLTVRRRVTQRIWSSLIWYVVIIVRENTLILLNYGISMTCCRKHKVGDQ